MTQGRKGSDILTVFPVSQVGVYTAFALRRSLRLQGVDDPWDFVAASQGIQR
jgi:hypothetical protein